VERASSGRMVEVDDSQTGSSGGLPMHAQNLINSALTAMSRVPGLYRCVGIANGRSGDPVAPRNLRGVAINTKSYT
jgi:hypothetical protein